MLELKNINITLSKDARQLADNFSFTLNQGDKAVIIGEEGNGKSTLLKMIYDESLIEDYCTYSGQITKKGKTAYLPQMMDSKHLNGTVAEFFENEDFLSPSDIPTDIRRDVLIRLGITPEFTSSKQIIKTLSGGEKIKMQLAKILMEEPEILLLDEPTNDIDIETLEWLEGFIKRSRVPILFVSHDEMLIENVANVIIHIEQLIRKTKPRISVSHSSYREYIDLREATFGKQMQVAKKQRSDYQKQMDKWRQINSRVEHEQRVISRQDPGGGRLLKKKMKSVKSQEKRLKRQTEDFLEIPQIEDAIITEFSENISIPKSKVVLDFSLKELTVEERLLSKNIKLTVIGNEHIGIVGENGSGKSTLLSRILMELKDRQDIIISYMPQDYAEVLDYSLTPVDFLSDNYSKEDITRARSFMGSMRFTHEEMTGKIGNLSGGQKAKILFLDMVLRNANVLLLDEPTRNFSPLSSPVVRQALKGFGGAIISISHDRKYLKEVCDKVYKLSEGGLELQ